MTPVESKLYKKHTGCVVGKRESFADVQDKAKPSSKRKGQQRLHIPITLDGELE